MNTSTLSATTFDLKKFVNNLKHELANDPYWKKSLSELTSSKSAQPNFHLAIFVDPFLTFMLEGKKTIESRFSINRIAPYHKITKGDVILIKESGGPIVGVCKVQERWYYNLDPKSWTEIRKYEDALCITDPSFWKRKKKAAYGTLIKVHHIAQISPMEIEKKDRRGWIVLTNHQYEFF